MKKTYIVAGCRPWNRVGIMELQKSLDENLIGVTTPDELSAAIEESDNIKYIFFLHWSHIVPDEVTTSYECVCFHMTNVPYGRGGSPLQNLIVRGKRQTKLTALRMTSQLDAGPVYLKSDLSLEGSSAEEIYMRAERLSCEMLKELILTEPVPTAQTGEVTLFMRRKPEESSVPLDADLLEVHDFIRMLDADDYPKAYLELGSLRFEFTRSTLYQGEVKAEVSIKNIKQ